MNSWMNKRQRTKPLPLPDSLLPKMCLISDRQDENKEEELGNLCDN